ncbi:FAD-binding oxidoreductase [Alteromonas sp. NFXS44]|uniref:FAD-binding oxidoreductase n=1 Tax=Alteromonas sp. NFXS44 TaxID=2818435 RepID=UPI0032DEF019
MSKSYSKHSRTITNEERRTFIRKLAATTAFALAAPVFKSFSAQEKSTLENQVSGNVFWKDSPRYESIRGANTYRSNEPKRYPLIIVQPLNDDDVVAAVKFARQHKLKVTTRSGGHAWSASHIREGCLLVDMSLMQQVDIDEKRQTLWTNTGVLGSKINAMLKTMGLIIPTAHHPSPGIGGFTMNGGFGWNSRKWGNGARQLLAIDVVTADGELIRADATQNTDYLWAARGSGQGFFGIVTRMQIQAHPRPKVWKRSVYGFRPEQFDELITWIRNVMPEIPEEVEMVLVSTSHDAKTGDASAPRLTVAALSLADTDEECDRQLDFIDTCPILDKAYFTMPCTPTTLEECYMSGYSADPAGFRFAVDNMYTNASAEELLPRIREVFLNQPTPRTHTFWHCWGPTKPYEDDMALSMQGDVFIATYTLWTDPALDTEMHSWPVAQIKALEDLSIGAQMNDENMLDHAQDYLSKAAYSKLERLRAKHDPNGVFASFLGSPQKYI